VSQLISDYIYDSIISYIYDTEVSNNNLSYDINKDIKVHNITTRDSGIINDTLYTVDYSVEYISVKDVYVRKWNTKKANISYSTIKDRIRDSKLNVILKK